MQTRKIGSYDVSAIGLGCMCLSHAYGTPPDAETAAKVLHRALDLGYTHLDTAALYGLGANETLIGTVLKARRKEFFLATKCGMAPNEQGVRTIDSRPEAIRRVFEESLKRLQTDSVELLYLHRWDKKVPIEESVGAMAELVREGKAGGIGLSEVSAATLQKAHAVHPIAAVQSEYSLWSRNAEIAVLDTCRALGVAYVAFSPLARGFLTATVRDPSTLPAKDLRLSHPRFQGENWEHNVALLPDYERVAQENDCTPSQLAIAWLLAKSDIIVPIPGTTRLDHLEEDARAADVRLKPGTMEKLDALINQITVKGARYNAATLPEIDTEGD